MADDTLPNHELLEEVLQTRPKRVLDLLPDSIDVRSAQRNLDVAYAYAKQAREKAKESTE